ncbi:MAG TPA: hypothetical protein VN420_03760 [Candidatus Fimivivens sp.]|nr:hypothetical protein [Candidatus Fimivivens sp.]
MTEDTLKTLVQDIVEAAVRLKDAKTDTRGVAVGYACIFPRNEGEYRELRQVVETVGKETKTTPTGSVYLIPTLETVAGPIRVLKVRIPDVTRPERGDADFNLADYEEFKRAVLGKPGFTLIPRGDFEMIELMDPDADVRVYFSNPPVERQLGLQL